MSDLNIVERMDWIWRLCIAHGFTFILLILNLNSYSLPFSAEVRPYFILMAMYFWTIYRPNILPPLLLFLTGLTIDLLSGINFLGLHAAILLSIQWMIRNQRLYLMGQPFTMIWLGFALTAIAYGFSQWGTLSILSFKAHSMLPLGFSIALSILIFPLLAGLLNLIHRLLPIGGKTYS